MAKRRAICNVHSDIDDLIDDLLELNPLSLDVNKVNEIAIKMRVLIFEAMESGQVMEDRLKKYREAIEGLGFIRDKDNKLKEEIEQLKAKVFELENLPKE